jgi:hypothetical protein
MYARMKKRASIPRKRTTGLLVEAVGDEAVVYDLETREAHCLKPLAAVVFECCDGAGSISDLAATASRRLSTNVTDDDVAEAVRQLEQLKLLDTPLVVLDGANGNGNGVSRREALRRIGFVGATAASATLVTSIAVPAVAWASGIPAGCSNCGKNSDCASGHCCQSNGGKQCAQTCCVGGNNSCHFTGDPNNPTCTVCISDTGCGTCPCSQCPGGSSPCCTTTC